MEGVSVCAREGHFSWFNPVTAGRCFLLSPPPPLQLLTLLSIFSGDLSGCRGRGRQERSILWMEVSFSLVRCYICTENTTCKVISLPLFKLLEAQCLCPGFDRLLSSFGILPVTSLLLNGDGPFVSALIPPFPQLLGFLICLLEQFPIHSILCLFQILQCCFPVLFFQPLKSSLPFTACLLCFAYALPCP